MRKIVAVIALLILLLPVASAWAYDAQELPVPAGPDFPRLAMWHPDFNKNSLEECARYDMAVGNFQVYVYDDPSRGTFYEALKMRNPNIKLMTYFTTSVLRHSALYGGTRKSNPYMPDWPAEWFLTEAGTTLSEGVDRRAQFIKVTDWRQTGESKGNKPKEWDIFRAGTATADRDVLVDGEIMSVIAVDAATKTLTVKRGMNGTRAVPHPAGVRIAPILRFWAGSYICNLSETCPRAQLHGASEPELFSEYSFRMSKTDAADWFWYIGGEQDGFCLDLMADTITWTLWADTRSIDLDQDNKSDKLSELDASWKAGIDRVTALFRADFPGKAVIRNNCRGRRYEINDGECFMSWPHFQWADWDMEDTNGKTKYWHRFFFGHEAEERGGIVQFVEFGGQPNYTHIETCDFETDLDFYAHPELKNPDKPEWYKPNYQKMRWGLTSALISGTYYVYVIHTDGHGQLGLLWFDEYDDSHLGNGQGRGYLGQPITGIQKLVTHKKNKAWGVWGREFDNGFVICNPLEYDAEVPLPPGQWQRLKGSQDQDVNTGAVEEGSVIVPAYDGLILKRYVEGQEEEVPVEEAAAADETGYDRNNLVPERRPGDKVPPPVS
ncbi:hypothetical protein JW859_06520 [bacterium]|nr:hypothetical protein [bacterium]